MIEGNEIGLDAIGEPVNGTTGILVRSEEMPALRGTRITGNRVAGYRADIVVAGKDATDTVVENNLSVSVVFGVVLPLGVAGEVEVFGNRAGESQGRVPLMLRSLPAGKILVERFDVEPTSAFATSAGFTATSTRNGKTSGFGMPTAAVAFEFPEMHPLSVDNGDLQLQWSDADSGRFVLEAAPSPAGPWAEVPVSRA